MPLLCLFTATMSPVMVQFELSNSCCSCDRQGETDLNKLKSDLKEYNSGADVTDHLVISKSRRWKKTKRRFLPVSPVHIDPNLDFPFLRDPLTIKLIRKSRVLFLMRGLPGSGKSTIVRYIISTFPGSVVCSADDYFLQDGVYNFDPSCLTYAHKACQSKAEAACHEEVGVVVVDNTNVRRWEVKFYLDLASQRDYVVVPVQPKTAWRFDPVELARRNKHGVMEDILMKKVNQFEDIIPHYYGWFLRDTASAQLVFISKYLLQQCLQQIPELADRLLRQLSLSRSNIRNWDHLWEILQEYYISPNRSGSMMHCTAKFCGRGRAEGAYQYHSEPRVQEAVGKAFTLVITSICFSPHTVGARVSLDHSELKLFDKPEERGWKNDQSCQAPPNVNAKCSQAHTRPPGRRTFHTSAAVQTPTRENIYSLTTSSSKQNQPYGDVCPEAAEDMNSMMASPRAQCTSLEGRSAHITLGIARGVEARETTFDVLRLCDMEAAMSSSCAEFVPVTEGELHYFGDGVCCVYFSKPMHVHTLFSGYY